MIDENGTQEAFRLTNNPAGNYEPCWSPFAIPLSDGSNRPLVTFTSNRQGNPDIFVMDTDGVDQSKSLTDYTNTDCNPSWSPDGSKVAYASFKDGQYDVWIMNFAIRTSILSVPSIKQVSGLEIISPKGGQNIDNLRPVFEWWGIRGQTSYRIVARKDITSTTFPKNISPAEASPESGARPAIAYSIGEFDDGLARGEWNWKVQALDQNNNIIAETPEESFEINPPFTISNITNYPNPFNPNKERTKIRYKLSKDADDVTIRIYDIMGSLVNELSGLPFGEIVNIWLKYNDIDWDGRNGRGDVVVNGIYPFEVVARLGDKSVSGRGKIAVLK
jgi:flagellar hook assembly protein FlgD